MTSSAFSGTLKSITTTKLSEISKKRQFFEDNKSSILESIQHEPNQQKKLRILLDGVKKSFAIKTVSRKRGRSNGGPGEMVTTGADQALVIMLKNLERFLEQARYDPTISSKLLTDWEQSLMKKLNIQSLKYQYATLYGELVNDWLNSEQGHKDTSSMDIDGFEVIDKAEKQEARKEWEKAVFEPLETDRTVIASYLQHLFGKAGSIKALTALRKSIENFEVELSASDQFNEDVLRWTINGLLSSGLLSEEKNQVLKDFLGSSIILSEVADVLNMRIVSIENWAWEQEYVPVEQRRHLNGNYHIYIDEDLLEAIFLQYIGVRWSVFFKEAFTSFSNHDGAWASLRKPISKEELKRREYFLGPQHKKPSVQSKRQGIHKSFFFMTQLPNAADEGPSVVAGEEEANYDDGPRKRIRARQVARNAVAAPTGMGGPQQMGMMLQQQAQQQAQQQQVYHQHMAQRYPAMMQQQAPTVTQSHVAFKRRNNRLGPGPGPQPYRAESDEYDSEDDDTIKPKSQMETKQFLLHLLSTEIIFNTRFHGDFTCTRSEFESWSPTLPHSTIRSVLSFFGISQRWLGFFTTFLEAPLKFIEDGPNAETRTRKRGVPGAHSLSSMCGEAVLFVLDFAVNQKTNGAQLYRMHDDFWLWSSSHDTVVKGWEAVTTFTDVMGVTLNAGKTGTVRIQRDHNQTVVRDIHPNLPEGEIRWGFLILDPTSGRFIIDQKMVDKHIDELQRQLQDKKSVFSWIQAWNTYAGTFFKSNFGKPANCFGRQHVDMMLETMTRIQTRIFGESNVVEYLKSTIEAKFRVTDIPDGYLYFPTSLGGLELQNPFIGTIQVRSSVCEKPGALIETYLEDELEAYRQAQKKYDSGLVERYMHFNNDREAYKPDNNTFLSFEEFCRYREDFSASWEGNLLGVYEEMLRRPEEVNVDTRNGLMGVQADTLSAHGELDNGYLRWVGMLYGEEMLEKFGGLNVVDKGLLPVGMVNLFRSGRIRWQG